LNKIELSEGILQRYGEGGYGYEAEEGEGEDEGYGNDWTILSKRKYCPQKYFLAIDSILER